MFVLLGEHPDRARRLNTPPRPLAPHQPHRPVEAGRVDQDHVAAAVTVRDDAASTAAHHRGRGLRPHGQHPDVDVAVHTRDVQAVKPDEQIAP